MKNTVLDHSRDSHDSVPFPAFDDDKPRFLLNEAKEIIHGSDAFYNLIKSRPQKNEVLNSRDIFNVEIDFDIIDVQKSHHVSLNGGEGALSIDLEWLVTPYGERYLIGVCNDGGLANDVTFEDQKTPDARDPFAQLSQDIKIILDTSGTVQSIENHDSKLLGVKVGSSFYDLFREDDQAQIHSDFKMVCLHDYADNTISNEQDIVPEPLSFEIPLRLQSHKIYRWSLLRRANAIYCVGQDISNILKYKYEAEKTKKQLTQAESIGGMGHWHWQIGRDVVEWSTELYKIFGVDESFVPTLENINASVLRRDVPRANQILQRAIIEAKNYETDFRIKLPSGGLKHIRCEGRCELDDDGDIIALYGIMQDMTERFHNETQLMEEKNRAERALAAKSQFLANMSHELRTPLNAIIGFSEMMQQQLLGPIGQEKYLEYIDGIRESGGHLLDLISDILSISKIEAGKYHLSLNEVNLYKTFRMALQIIEGRAHEANVALNIIALPPESFNIIADRRAVLQITLNILSNAVKFTKEKGRIDFEFYVRDEHIIFKISDTGIGIPANKLANITSPFEQVACSYTRNHEGTGLGLAITKELVEMHGGNLHIESKLGIGTSVTVRLPKSANLS